MKALASWVGDLSVHLQTVEEWVCYPKSESIIKDT